MAELVPLNWRSSIERLRQNISGAYAGWVSKFKRGGSDDADLRAPTMFESTAQGIEVDEGDDELIARAVVSGLGKNDFKVEVTEDRLVIRGSKSRSSSKKGGGYSRYEVDFASFAQAIFLPCEIDRDRVKTKYRNGMLAITLPKSDRSKRKRIKVQVNR
jgi:HSP20 family protein